MSDRRASMMATLADIRSKPSTPGRAAAAARIEAGLARMSEFAANAPRGGRKARDITMYDREFLMKVAGDNGRSQEERDRANAILGGSELTSGDAEFIRRAEGKGEQP